MVLLMLSACPGRGHPECGPGGVQGRRRRSRSDGSVRGSGSPCRFALDAAWTAFNTSADGAAGQRSPGQDRHPESLAGAADALSDDDLVLGYDLQGAVFGDVDDAAAHSLSVGQVDKDLIAWPPFGFRLVHGIPACAARLLVSRPAHTAAGAALPLRVRRRPHAAFSSLLVRHLVDLKRPTARWPGGRPRHDATARREVCLRAAVWSGPSGGRRDAAPFAIFETCPLGEGGSQHDTICTHSGACCNRTAGPNHRTRPQTVGPACYDWHPDGRCS